MPGEYFDSPWTWMSSTILRRSLQQCLWIFAYRFLPNLEKTVKGPIFAQHYLSLENLHNSTRSSVSPNRDLDSRTRKRLKVIFFPHSPKNRELKQWRFWAAHINRKCSLPRSRFLDVTQRSRCMTSRSEAFSFLICLDVTKFVLLGSLTFMQTIFSKFRAKPPPNNAKNTLPVGVRRSKTSL